MSNTKNKKNIADIEIKKAEIVPKRPFNWVAIRRDFVQGIIEEDKTKPIWFTYKELAQRYHVSVSKLSEKASLEKWHIQRSAYVLRLEKKVQDKRIQQLADSSSKFDSKCYNVALSGINEIEEQINFFSNLTNADGEKEFMTIDYLDRAARAIEKFQRVGRIALGLSPTNDSTSHNVQNIKIISFSEGLDKVQKQIKSNPGLHDKLLDELND